MSTQACYPGDPYPQPHYPCWQQPHYPLPTYGTGVTTWIWPGQPVTEERIREIIREELREALKGLKAEGSKDY